MTRLRNLIIVIQLACLAATACIFVFHLQMTLDGDQVQMFGANLTMVLVVLGFINHHQATKGNYYLVLLSLPALIPPAYALIGSITRHLIVAHLMVLILHYMVYAYVNKRQKAPNTQDTPGSEDQLQNPDEPAP